VPGALAGVKVLDLSQMWAVPGAGMYLADQGADITKVEPPWGDDARRLVTATPLKGENRHFLLVNRGKRGIVVDITNPEGRGIIYRLIQRVDVLLHNFRPGVAERLGYGYDTLRALNPRLIFVEVTPFGLKGPYADKRGYDLVTQGLTGILSRRRMPDGTPIEAPVWVADCSAPMLIAYGVVLALLARERTGRGQKVETSLLAAAIAMQSVEMVRGVEEVNPPTSYAVQAMFAPYRCRDGEWLVLVVANNEQWNRLCKVLGIAHVAADPGFSTALARSERSGELASILEGVFATKPREEWLELLQAEEVPCAPVLEREEVFNHAQVLENELIVEVDHPRAGRVRQMGLPVRLSEMPGALGSPAPAFDQHTDEVLREVGCTADEIRALREKGIVGKGGQLCASG